MRLLPTRCQLLRLGATLCLLLLTAQAVLPRDLVLCLHDSGAAAFELGHHGRCLGLAAPATARCLAAPGGTSQVERGELAPRDGQCIDQPVTSAEARLSRMAGLAAPPQAVAVLPLGSLAPATPALPRCLTRWQTDLRRSPQARLTACIVLRI
jgi:hypothetical protein